MPEMDGFKLDTSQLTARELTARPDHGDDVSFIASSFTARCNILIDCVFRFKSTSVDSQLRMIRMQIVNVSHAICIISSLHSGERACAAQPAPRKRERTVNEMWVVAATHTMLVGQMLGDAAQQNYQQYRVL